MNRLFKALGMYGASECSRGKNWGTMLCGHYWLEREPISLEVALALERVNSGLLDHA